MRYSNSAAAAFSDIGRLLGGVLGLALFVFMTLEVDADQNVVTIAKGLQLVPLKAEVVGFNTPMGGPGVNGDYTSPKLLAGAERLPVGALRYPGGTVGNYFNWYSQTLDARQVERVRHPRMKAALKKDLDRNAGGLTRVDLESFFAACRSIDARPFIVVNLLTSGVNSSIESIDSAKSIYRKPIFWELGNELSYTEYAKQYNVPGGWSADIYTKKANEIVAHIRKRYPEDRIGIVASEMVWGRALIPNRKINSIEKTRRCGTKQLTV